MLDSSNNLLLRNKERISLIHKWGLYLDNQKNLWVLSSDIGHSKWNADSLQTYHHHIFREKLDRDDIPDELYNNFQEMLFMVTN